VARYRNDPTVMLWQMMNEPEAADVLDGRCGADAAYSLNSFARDVGALIKQIDAQHLVSVGTLGTGQCGTSGSEYLALHAIPSVDVAEYHDYSLDALPGDRWNGLAERLRQMSDLAKPLIVGEIGVIPQQVGGMQGRAALMRRKLDTQFDAGVAGALLWAWRSGPAGGSTAADYDIGPGDPVLAELADVTRQRRHQSVTSRP